VKVDGNLDELRDGAGQLAEPIGSEAEQEAALSALVDGAILLGVYSIVENKLVGAELAVDIDSPTPSEGGLPWSAHSFRAMVG
jgi:hypothetical protein